MSKTKKWREELVRSKWLDMDEGVGYLKVLIPINVMKIKIMVNIY
jgi:hypothetical protein